MNTAISPLIALRNSAVQDLPPSGNGNGRFDPGETGELLVALRNVGNQPANNVTAKLRSGHNLFVVSDSTSAYGNILACSTRTNSADPFRIVVDTSMPVETPVHCTLFVIGDGYSDTLRLTITVGETRRVDPVPDGPRQPPLYWAYDDVDTFYSEHPTFDWVEIHGLGTRLDLANDQTVQVSLPPGFVWQYYGQDYSDISICSNGWVAPGHTDSVALRNTSLPNPAMPPLVALNWDDLYPPSGNGVWYYHDAPGHRFVVEWDSIRYWIQSEHWDKFELIIYDTTIRTPTGDNVLLAQYLTGNNYAYSTVGLQDPTLSVAIQCAFNNTYHRAAAPLVAGRAIKYTTIAPGVAITERPETREMLPVMRTTPNPFRASVSLTLGYDPGKNGARLYDSAGRLVRTLFGSSPTWDCRDQAGRRGAPGVYFLRVSDGDRKTETKLVLIR